MVSLYSGRVAQLGDGTPILAVYRILRMTQGTPVGEGSRPTRLTLYKKFTLHKTGYWNQNSLCGNHLAIAHNQIRDRLAAACYELLIRVTDT